MIGFDGKYRVFNDYGVAVKLKFYRFLRSCFPVSTGEGWGTLVRFLSANAV
jgi:hypothetical protein